MVAAILPFNWPPIHFSKKCAPAIAVGNTVVIKPGEQAPLTVLRLVEIANEVLPPGVINAVSGLAAGPALASHPRVERITFTGATATGRKVMASAAKNLAFATLELGGKNALLVLDDADCRAAVAGWPSRACSTTRAKRARRLRGSWFSPLCMTSSRRVRRRRRSGSWSATRCTADTDIGPMVDERQQAASRSTSGAA